MASLDINLNYGLGSLLIAGGLMGFFQTGSIPSLLAGVGCGLALLYAAKQMSIARNKLFGYRLAIGK
jgi:uncharacterized membrane protein (UPF0136 family)